MVGDDVSLLRTTEDDPEHAGGGSENARNDRAKLEADRLVSHLGRPLCANFACATAAARTHSPGE